MKSFVYDDKNFQNEIYLVKEEGFHINNDRNDFLKSDCIVDINGNTFGRVIFENMTIINIRGEYVGEIRMDKTIYDSKGKLFGKIGNDNFIRNGANIIVGKYITVYGI